MVMSKLNLYLFCYTKYSLNAHMFVCLLSNVRFDFSDFPYVEILEKYKI